MRAAAVAALVALFAAPVAPAHAVVLGELDTFSASTEGWFAGGGPLGGVPPTPPTVIADGGPGGVGDSYLQVASTGSAGPGSRLVAMNAAQWAGDYLSAGIAGIAMDLRNLGATDLTLRLLFEDPMGGAPANVGATSFAVTLFAGGGWTHVVFPIAPADLTMLAGDAATLLASTTVMRLYYGPDAIFPGPTLAASLGVDNIEAVGASAVPEPGALALLLGGLGLLAGRRIRKAG